ERGTMGDMAALQRDQRGTARRRLGRLHRPRPPARGRLFARPGESPDLGMALSYRPLYAEPADARAAPPLPRALPRRRLSPAAVRPGRDERAGPPHPARD